MSNMILNNSIVSQFFLDIGLF